VNTNVYSIYQEQSAAVDRRRFGLDLPQWQISLDNDITTTFLASAHTNNPIYVLIAATHPVNKLLCLLQNSKGSRVRFASVWIASPWPLSSPHRNTQKYTSGVGEGIWTGHGIPAMCHWNSIRTIPPRSRRSQEGSAARGRGRTVS